MTRRDRIQYLLISHLLEEGQIELKLPDGMILELGICKEDKYGKLKNVENYSWVIASQDERTIIMDSYNVGLRYRDENGKILMEDETVDENGRPLKIFSVV